MRKKSEGLFIVSSNFKNKHRKYLKQVIEPLKITTYKKKFIDIELPYNFKEVFHEHIQNSQKTNGLTLMIKKVDFHFIASNKIRIYTTKIFKRGIFSYTNKTKDNNLIFELSNYRIEPSKGEYGLMFIFNELLYNHPVHSLKFEDLYKEMFSINISSLEEFKKGLSEGKHIFYTDSDKLEKEIISFIWIKDYLSDIIVNDNYIKASRLGEHSWSLSVYEPIFLDLDRKLIEERRQRFEKEICGH